MPKPIIACLLVLLSACASTSKVVQVGKDSYMVVGLDEACPLCAASDIRAARAASRYCASLSKVMLLRYTQTAAFDLADVAHRTSLIFSCLDANDPAYTATTLRKDNGVTTIETVRH